MMFRLPVAVHLLLIKDDRILLLRRHNTGFEDGNLPGNTIPYIRQAIENFRVGAWFDSYGWL